MRQAPVKFEEFRGYLVRVLEGLHKAMSETAGNPEGCVAWVEPLLEACVFFTTFTILPCENARDSEFYYVIGRLMEGRRSMNGRCFWKGCWSRKTPARWANVVYIYVYSTLSVW